jgi:hypothetical protein
MMVSFKRRTSLVVLRAGVAPVGLTHERCRARRAEPGVVGHPAGRVIRQVPRMNLLAPERHGVVGFQPGHGRHLEATEYAGRVLES